MTTPCPRCHLVYTARLALMEHLHVEHLQSRAGAAIEADDAIREARQRAGRPASEAPAPTPEPTPVPPTITAPEPAEAPQTQEDPMPTGQYDRSKVTCPKCGKVGHTWCGGAPKSATVGAVPACSYCKRSDGSHSGKCKRATPGPATVAPRKTGPGPGRAPKVRTASPTPVPTNGQPARVPTGPLPVATVALLRAKVAELRADADALELAIRLLGGAA